MAERKGRKMQNNDEEMSTNPDEFSEEMDSGEMMDEESY